MRTILKLENATKWAEKRAKRMNVKALRSVGNLKTIKGAISIYFLTLGTWILLTTIDAIYKMLVALAIIVRYFFFRISYLKDKGLVWLLKGRGGAR